MATHLSQMVTFGPATSFATSTSLFPQKEQANRFRLNIPSTSRSLRTCSEKTTPSAVLR
jgi:hypothetical protein